MVFLMQVVTIQHLKQGQGHQTWYELVDPKQDYNLIMLSMKENTSDISLENL